MGTQRLNSFSDPAPPDNGRPSLVPPPPRTTSTATVEEPPRVTVWMHRISLVIYVIFCVEVGMLLAALPWMRIWTENSLVFGYPTLKAVLQHGFVRGAVTGIGLLDIFLGIWEAVHYRESRNPSPDAAQD
jgi:hypothetical protein